jgi:hypothetical protein
VEWAAPVRRQDVMRRTFRPVLPAIHLALPIVVPTRYPDLAEQYPELAAAAAPSTFAELALSHRWVFQAIDAAERWRQALPSEWDLIEVRARWTGFDIDQAGELFAPHEPALF